MKIRFTFSHRIVANFLVMAILLILVGYFALVTMKGLQRTANTVLKENVSSLKAAEELELALLNQKGLVSSYFLDGNPIWLKTLEEKKRDFDIWFKNAKDVALTGDEKRILQDIHSLYKTYDHERNRAIKLYQSENISEAKKILLNDMKNSIESLYTRCEDLLLVNEILIARAERSSQKNVFKMTMLIWMIIIATLCLGSLMGFATARKINDELIRSAKMASLGQLSANVAHEIRNPLTSIKMRLYTLQTGLRDGSEFKDDLGIIEEEMGRLEGIVKNFLNFAKPPKLNLQVCRINEVLEGVVNLLEPKARFQNVRIEKRINSILPESEIDKEQMRQVFLNIMLNAIEAMPNGGVLEIITFLSNNNDPNSMLEIQIKDSGKGVDPALKNRLFEPFVTTKEQGTGLGLFIASRIVKMHNGSMKIDSHLDSGTAVIVKLPLSSKVNKRKKIRKSLLI